MKHHNNENGIQPQFNYNGIGVEDIKTEVEQQLSNQAHSLGANELTGEQLINSNIQQIPFLLENILLRVGLAGVAGSSDIGKSCFLRQLVIAISAGDEEFLGFRINARHNSALVFSTEDYIQATAFFLRQQAKQYRPDQLKGLRFIFDYEDIYEELSLRLTESPADLVVIDCFQDAFGGDLKDTQKIRAFLHPFQQLAEHHQCLILFIHHTGKRTENFEPNKNNLLSGQGLEAKLRLVIELRADQMNPNQRHLCIVKGNYLPGRFKKESFVLHFEESTFTFTNTGDRMPFELLTRQPNEDNSKAKYEQALELKERGYTYDQIAKSIGYNNKGSVSKLFDKAQKNGWDKTVSNTVSIGNEGNEEETPI